MIGGSATTTETGEALRLEGAKYGYDNLSLARTRNGVTTDVPWNWVPSEFAEAYYTEEWELHDPELFVAQRTLFPFRWARVLQTVPLSAEQRRVADAAAAMQLSNGICVPMHGPDGQLDILTFSTTHRDHSIDPAHHNAVALLGLRAVSRFLELEKLEPESVSGCASRSLPRRERPLADLDDLSADPSIAPFTLPAEHLRALVLVEAGARRWKLGLTKLASSVYLLRKLQPYAELERWGFIVDEVDDVRWRYYLAPSVLGMSYLRRTPGSVAIRREIWQRELARHELPDGLQAD